MDKYYDNYNNGFVSSYDKNHSDYRAFQFQRFMQLREKEYINNFRFEGDDEFTRAKQRTFLSMCFRYGYSAVLNTDIMVKDKLEPIMFVAADTYDIDLDKTISDLNENKIPVSIFPSLWGNDRQPEAGIANTAAIQNDSDKKVYNFSNKNAAILTFDEEYRSGWWWWLLPAYDYAMGKTVGKKRLSTLDGKLVNNKINNTYKNIKYDNLYDVNESYLELAPSQTSITGDKNSEAIDVMKMLDTKLKKLDLSNGESILDLLEYVKENEKSVMYEMGKRVNINEGKQERSISADFEAVEAHFRLKESEQEDYMEMFLDNYKRVFNKELTLKISIKETLNDLREQELAKSGREQGQQKQQGGEDNDK